MRTMQIESLGLWVEDHGSIVLVRGTTDAARAALRDGAPDDAQWVGDAVAVEPRYVEAVVDFVGDAIGATP